MTSLLLELPKEEQELFDELLEIKTDEAWYNRGNVFEELERPLNFLMSYPNFRV